MGSMYEHRNGYFVADDIAKMYDVSKNTVWSWLKNGMLRSEIFEGEHPRYWIADSAVQEFDNIFGDLLSMPRNTNCKKPFMKIGKMMSKRWDDILERRKNAEEALDKMEKTETAQDFVLDSNEGIYDGFDELKDSHHGICGGFDDLKTTDKITWDEKEGAYKRPITKNAETATPGTDIYIVLLTDENGSKIEGVTANFEIAKTYAVGALAAKMDYMQTDNWEWNAKIPCESVQIVKRTIV